MSVSAWIRRTVERAVDTRTAPKPTTAAKTDARGAVERLQRDVAELAATLERGDAM